MRLIDPGVGEYSDRLSILSLKILFGQQAGKEVSHFQKEKATILVKLRAKELNGAWFEAYTDLAAVNSALWHAEDDLRAYRASGGEPTTIVGVAVRIQALNDRRAELVAAINKATGEAAGEEKV